MKRNKRFSVKRLKDNRAMINLGCGTKTKWSWNNLDFSPYAYLAHHKMLAKILNVLGLLSEKRYQRLLKVSPDIVFWDLRKGIPFDNEIFDVVYHSHFLEHIDKNSVLSFLKECHRVLKKKGILRIVIPDLEAIASCYTSFISEVERGKEFDLSKYQQIIYELFGQMVRKESTGTTQQRPLVRLIERFMRGDAAKIGELHRWMYDKYSLGKLLSMVGFGECEAVDAFTSRIDGWIEFNLDADENGIVYKPGSLYMECTKR